MASQPVVNPSARGSNNAGVRLEDCHVGVCPLCDLGCGHTRRIDVDGHHATRTLGEFPGQRAESTADLEDVALWS